jgi:glycosidase
MGIACLFGLHGIPCIYYGTEQGLKGTQELYSGGGGSPEHVREALWGKMNAFDSNTPLYKQISQLSKIKKEEPTLRYGRQYFRPVSGNNADFGTSKEKGGVIAVSRILNNREVVLVANCNASAPFPGWVLVDPRLHDDNVRFMTIYSNCGSERTSNISSGDVIFYNRDGSTARAFARRVRVELLPMEVQMLVPEWMFHEILG